MAAPALPSSAAALPGGARAELEAQVTLVRAAAVARLLTALAVSVLAWGLPLWWRWALAILIAATAASLGPMLRRDIPANRLPSQGALLFAGLLDMGWLALGYIATGGVAIPFIPLLALAIGLHGVLLTAARCALVSVAGSIAFLWAYFVLGRALPSPAFTADLQAALFVGVGIVSALLGNRIRAAGWTVAQLHEMVRALAGHHHSVLSALPAGVVILGPETVTPRVNASAAALLALSEAPSHTAVRMTLERLLPEVAAAVAAVLSTAVGTRPERRGLATVHGRRVAWVVAGQDAPDTTTLAAGTALSAPARWGRVPGAPTMASPVRTATVVLVDDTERLEAEDRARHAEHFAAIAELSAGLAHEVRNPVAAIRSAAEQLLDDRAGTVTLTTDDRALLEGILLREADRLNALVTDFLAFARQRHRVDAPESLTQVVHHAVALAREAWVSLGGVRDAVRLDCDVPAMTVRIDAELLTRAVSNVVLNALQFSPRGSTVEIRASVSPTHVVLAVRDFGPGIAPERRTRVFHPFVTTRPAGTGLGLAVAARAAATLGGTLTCVTPPGAPDTGAGACFLLTLPRTAGARPASEADPAA